MSNTSALLLFSGGQDSATCLAWACSKFERVHTVGYTYGQRHDVEMSCRNDVRSAIVKGGFGWSEKIASDHILDLAALGQISETAMTRNIRITTRPDGLPSTFVPGRNLIFLTFAAALADRLGAGHLVAGMCEADFSGYPDCRHDTLEAQMTAIRLGMASDLALHTPLMHLSKAGAWNLARTLGGDPLVEIIRTQSHTCYLGDRTPHVWGAGCGTCPACDLRARGWAEYVALQAA